MLEKSTKFKTSKHGFINSKENEEAKIHTLLNIYWRFRLKVLEKQNFFFKFVKTYRYLTGVKAYILTKYNSLDLNINNNDNKETS